jgi:hypothetical protein
MSVAAEASTSETNTGVGDGVISANSSYVLLGSTTTSLLSRCVGRTGTCNSNIAKDGNLGPTTSHTSAKSNLWKLYYGMDQIIFFRPQNSIIYIHQQIHKNDIKSQIIHTRKLFSYTFRR